MTFASLGLLPHLCAAATQAGFLEPTDIQRQAIPAILRGDDVLACAQTGSGKTGAYALPLLQALIARPHGSGKRQTRVLVLVPTRELAMQVEQVMRVFAAALDTSSRAQPVLVHGVFGGVSINPQMIALRGGADCVVATPGRLLDLVAHNALSLSNVQTLVLDEADRLLDLGFSDELNRIHALLPVARQNLLLSATFAAPVTLLANALLRNPVRITLDAQSLQQPDIAQSAIAVDTSRRTQLLRTLVSQYAWERVLVFVATKFAAEIVADKLRKAGLHAEPLHGQLSQGKRTQVLDDFKASRIQVVVATDLAARGIDIAQLPVVINYDLPRSADDYTHRIGRTGRAGEAGLAVSFITADSLAHWNLIQKRHLITVTLEAVEGFEPTETPHPPPPDSATTDPQGVGGIKGKRPSKKDKLRAAQAATQFDASL